MLRLLVSEQQGHLRRVSSHFFSIVSRTTSRNSYSRLQSFRKGSFSSSSSSNSSTTDAKGLSPVKRDSVSLFLLLSDAYWLECSGVRYTVNRQEANRILNEWASSLWFQPNVRRWTWLLWIYRLTHHRLLQDWRKSFKAKSKGVHIPLWSFVLNGYAGWSKTKKWKCNTVWPSHFNLF